MVAVNQNVCIGCGACVKDCPADNLLLNENKAAVKDECFLCGHCIAICPVNAVSMDDYNMDEVIEYEKETFELSPQNLLNAIKFRRSIRNFKDQAVDQQQLQQILEAGRFTPTGRNSQGVRFYVFQQELDQLKEMVWKAWFDFATAMSQGENPYGQMLMKFYENYQQDSSNDRLFLNAPMVILVATDYSLDAGLASANMEMMAVSQGLGVLYDGFVVHAIEHSPEVKEWLNLDDKKVECCMLLGYPNVKYQRTVPRREADIVWR